MIRTWTTIAVDMDVLLGRNTWPSKRSRSTTTAPRRSRRPGTRTPKVRQSLTTPTLLAQCVTVIDLNSVTYILSRPLSLGCIDCI